MNMMVRSKKIKIGNSHGIRIPRAVLEQAGLTDDVEMTIEGNKLIIQSSRNPRQGWGERFAEMAKYGEDQLLGEPSPTQWDEGEWTW